MSVLSYEHAQNVCYWRSANWASIEYKNDATASPQLQQNRKCPHGTSITLSRSSIRHTSHMSSWHSSDSGGSNGRQSGIHEWLVVTSISVPVTVVFGRHLESLGVSTQTVADCLQKLQSGVCTVVVSLNARLGLHAILNVAFLYWPPNLNTMSDPVCIGHAVDRNILEFCHFLGPAFFQPCDLVHHFLVLHFTVIEKILVRHFLVLQIQHSHTTENKQKQHVKNHTP